ncbi:FAS1-like dehydratase domain-containing protein [Haladaptatus salinisoli]|uniref:FAS1-like dehydratase domain-containing protein n=1 Tax=Haladaptatus salinisoli TaxID=2884876 RepID=UPI001D0BAE43|nr:MaoC family dehydratase N-terminal domain-containing protein [Haladaptatus salinisoli]
MPNEPLSALESQVGATNRTVEGFRVEAGKVAEFARAIRDPHPTYRDLETAREAGHHSLPAPPTFTRSSFFPRYRPPGVDHDFGFDLGFRREYVLHGEQRFRYERPLHVDDELYGETTLEDVFQREGRSGGTMTFAVLRTDFYDADSDALVQSAWNTRIETDGAPTGESAPARGEIDAPEDAAPAEDAADLTVGAVGPTVETSPLERRDFVRYAGASGDFNPVHYDEPYATDAGHPSVFAQGMFSAGVASRLLREWFGLGGLESYRTRFTARAFPGDTLSARAEVREIADAGDEGADERGGRRVTVALEVVADDGQKVVDGDATAVV